MLSAYTESDPACKDSLNHLKGNCQSDHMFDPTPGLYLRVCTKNNFGNQAVYVFMCWRLASNTRLTKAGFTVSHAVFNVC